MTWWELIVKEMEHQRDEGIKAFAYGEDFDCSDLSREIEETSCYDNFAFTAWTANRVYFPACYDGNVWVASVPRNPCEEATSQVGGG